MSMRLPKVISITIALLISFPANSDDWLYRVKPGDNLWDLTERFLPDLSYVTKLQRYNSLKNPYQIPPGSTVRIPLDWLKSQVSSAQVVVVQGETFSRKALPQQESPLQAGEQLGINDKIITGNQSSAVIEFKDGSRVLIHDNTELILKRVERYPDSNLLETELLLEKGRIETEVPEKSKGKSVFKIKTPSAMTAVRGTFLRTNSDLSNPNLKKMRVEVIRGSVSVSGATARKTVTAGYGIVIAKDEPPGPVIRLLKAPSLIKPKVFIDRLATSFRWAKVEGGNSYRVQVFDDQHTPKLVWNSLSDTNRISVPDIPDGHYLMKVRAIDSKGLEGEEAAHHYTLDARPEPPLPASPDQGANVENKDLVLRWSAWDRAVGYHLQISNQKNFNTKLVDQMLETTEFHYQSQFKPGVYYWRLSTQVTDEEGPFSDTQTFTIIPPAPQALEPQGDDEHLIFRWQKGEPGLQYQMQLATDEAFTDLLLDKQLAEPRLEVGRPTNARLFLRMRPIADNSFKGNWSAVQYVDPPDNKPWYLLMLLPLFLLLLLL